VVSPTCSPVERTVSLGPSVLANGKTRTIATFGTCNILDGTVALNIPHSSIQLLAGHFEGNTMTSSIILNKTRIAQVANNQISYTFDLAQHMSGNSFRSGGQVTLGNINGFMIWNSANTPVTFNANNTAILNAIFAR
jgi:hypothetical protein